MRVFSLRAGAAVNRRVSRRSSLIIMKPNSIMSCSCKSMRGSPAYLFLSTLMAVIKDAFESYLSAETRTAHKANRLDPEKIVSTSATLILMRLMVSASIPIRNSVTALKIVLEYWHNNCRLCLSITISCRYPNTIIIDEALITIYLQSPRYVRSSTSSRCDDRSLT